MARKLRVQYEGAIYHLTSRGDGRKPVFRNDTDRQLFLDTLGEACQKTEWQVHAYCLMRNHFHLVIETPRANLVAGMKWLLGTYTGRFNRRHKVFGHLFSGRYKTLLVDGSQSGYLRSVCDYVHLNPVRARLLKPKQPLRSYTWSSYPEYLKGSAQRVGWLRVDRVLGEHGILKDSPAGRRQFEAKLQERRQEGNQAEWKKIRRGWCYGSEDFRKKLLAQIDEQMGENHYGPEKQEAAEEKAERLVDQELKRIGWTEELLRHKLKGDKRKVRIAQRLRAETTVSLRWIAERLKMGTWTYVSNRLYWKKRADGERKR